MNISVEKSIEKAADRTRERVPIAAREFRDPFRLWRDILHWDPFSMIARVTGDTFEPPFEVKETKDAYEFRADVPGVDAGNLEVRVTNDELTVQGKREEEHSEQTDTFYEHERSYGSFARTFRIPDGVNVDGAEAELRDGVLRVVLPKSNETKSRQVEIRAG
jgi:HSP20 family protein